MNEPAAFERARALKRFSAAPAAELAVVVSESEAFEVLDYLEATATPERFCIEKLSADIAEARLLCNPWFVLEHISIEGIPIARALELH